MPLLLPDSLEVGKGSALLLQGGLEPEMTWEQKLGLLKDTKANFFKNIYICIEKS